MDGMVLMQGSSGKDVLALQNKLEQSGFSPGVIDSEFGAATKAAVLAFQQGEGLLADGIVGPRTLTALGLGTSNALPDSTNAVTVQIVSHMFPNTHLENIKNNLPFVLQALVDRNLSDKPMVLMALCTIRAETEVFLPVSEGISRFNTSPNKHPFDLYDYRKTLGNKGPPDGERFRGRGFVQLTGRANYSVYGAKLNNPADLVANPETANSSSIAAQLLALFIGDRELAIKDALMHKNLQAARRLVNGGIHGLDKFSESYLIGDRLIPDTF
ncbi:MAG: peptidoglycan-binding protein [Herminiimonas sp.]|nr:peptidoglycan-binding protein [Herminiimonas sp.]